MKKLLALAIAALVTAVASPARATQPCEGSNSTCSWTCTQDGQGNIINYSVVCQYSEWCVGSDGSVDVGVCDLVQPPGDPVEEALAELALLDEAMEPPVCEAPPPKSPMTK